MIRPVSLVDALRPRAHALLYSLASRETSGSRPPLGHFSGYHATEELHGELSRFNDQYVVEFWRSGDYDSPLQPRLRFFNPVMVNIKEQSRSEPTVLSVVTEGPETIEINIPAGVRKKWHVEDILTKTVGFNMVAKSAWEAAAKVGLEVEYAGVKGSAELSGKYGKELERDDYGSEVNVHGEDDEIEFTGPVKCELEARREKRRELVTVRVRCDFDHAVYLDPGGDYSGIVSWESYKHGFLSVARGVAPNDATWYHEFMERPTSDEELEELERESGKLVEFEVEYDAVGSTVLKPVGG